MLSLAPNKTYAKKPPSPNEEATSPPFRACSVESIALMVIIETITCVIAKAGSYNRLHFPCPRLA